MQTDLCGAIYSDDDPYECFRPKGHDGEHSAILDTIEWEGREDEDDEAAEAVARAWRFGE